MHKGPVLHEDGPFVHGNGPFFHPVPQVFRTWRIE